MSTEIPEMLRLAIEKKVEQEVQPVRDALCRLRGCMTAYELFVEQDAQRRAVEAMLAALGQPAPDADATLVDATEAILYALDDVLGMLRKPEPAPAAPEPESALPSGGVTSPSPCPAPVSEVAAVPSPAPARATSHPTHADPAVVRLAWRTIDEIDNTEFKDEHPVRLAPLLEALVAECRWRMEQLPVSHDLQEHLSTAVRYLGRMRKEHGVSEFILGMAYSHKEDWARVSRAARARIAKFDLDAGTPIIPKKSNGNGKSSSNGSSEKEDRTVYQWPEFKCLRSRIDQGKTIVVVGGGKREEKLQSVRERFGLEATWHETEQNSPRKAEDMVDRIKKGGRVAAVVILNGLMSHTDYNRISEACSLSKVPCTLADRGGIRSLEEAFVEIERQCVLLCKDSQPTLSA